VKTALITGISGQDGSYLADFLLAKDYRVVGMLRRKSSDNLWRLEHLRDRIELAFGDLLDQGSLMSIVREYAPTEVYNLAAQSFVPTSWSQAVLTSEYTALGVTRLLEAVRLIDPEIHFYQASSSEMFGKARETPQRETTPFHPRSPYGVAKVYGHHITVNYRESHGIFACSGILFNHESPRRGTDFVSRKITYGAALIRHGVCDSLELGNLEARRDWGYAPDYVEAMWRMLQRDQADDFVIATGESHSVREFAERAFARAGLDWREHVVTRSELERPAEVDALVGDASKAHRELGWRPRVRFQDLVDLMVDADLELVAAQLAAGGLPPGSGRMG